jgi:hypothetical protein
MNAHTLTDVNDLYGSVTPHDATLLPTAPRRYRGNPEFAATAVEYSQKKVCR